jgi:peptidyl-prolyl cis-trans isomerase C
MISARSLTTWTVAVLAAAMLCANPAPVRAQNPDPVVARVNGVDIHESDLKVAEEEVGGSMANVPPAKRREALITYLSDVIVLAQAAEKQKLAEKPEVARQLALARNKVLMEALLQNAGRAAITDEALHKVYSEAVKQMPPEQEVHARHILVPTEAEAKAIEAQLKGGADFAKLAKEKSKDPSGPANGGDLGWFTKEQMVPQFAEAAFKLDKGQISDPVHTQFGWHIIKVEEKRTKPTPTFDDVKAQIVTFVMHRAQAQLVDSLRKAATIERLDQPPAPPTGPNTSLNPAAPVHK